MSGANSSTAQSNTAKQNTQLILDQTELATAETIEIKSPERNSILEIQPIKDRTQKSATIDSPKEASAVKKIFQRGVKPQIQTEASIATLALASSGKSSLLRNGLILIIIGLILQFIGGFSGFLVWAGSLLVLIGLIMIIIYLINQL